MTEIENTAFPMSPSIETVKKLLLEDLNKSSDISVDQLESSFCEIDDELPKKMDVDSTYSRSSTPLKRKIRSFENSVNFAKDSPRAINRTYSKSTPQKRVLKPLENTSYFSIPSPNTIQKQKRKKKIDEENDQAANKSIVEITEQFKKIENFELAVE